MNERSGTEFIYLRCLSIAKVEQRHYALPWQLHDPHPVPAESVRRNGYHSFLMGSPFSIISQTAKHALCVLY